MFEALIGNEAAKRILLRMLSDRRVPGALLFAGEEGVGKKLFAVEVAKSLNCNKSDGTIPACGSCAACTHIAQLLSLAPIKDNDEDKLEDLAWSGHRDVALVRTIKRTINIHKARGLEREAGFRPVEGRARVFLIEDAERMNEQTSNALLKTLEEMPATSHIILTTERPASLLPTIRSRVQTVRFTPLTNEEIEQALRTRSPKSSHTELKLKAQLARGSVGRATRIDADKYLALRKEMLDVLAALSHRTADKNDRAKLLRHAEVLNDAKHKTDYEPSLDVLTTLARDAWLLALDPDNANIGNADERERLRKIGESVGARRAARWIEMIEDLRRRLQININRRIATDQLFLQMADDS